MAMIVASLGAFVMGAPIAGAHAQTSNTYTGTRGQMTLAGEVNLSSLGSTAAAAATKKAPPRVMPLDLPNGAVRPSIAGNAPSAAGSSHTSAGALLANFNGVDEIQNSAASNTPLEPPDEGLAAGNGYVANFVNVTGAIYTTNGTTVLPPFALYALFMEPATANLSDPRVYYDASTGRWFASLFEYGTIESHNDLAVSTSGNPSTTWRIYRQDTTNSADYQCPCFPDFDQFGIDQNNVYISSNEFSLATSFFNGAEIYAISKSQLEHGHAHANDVRFGSLSQAGAPAYHVQPAITFGAPAAEYFLSSLDPNSTFDHRLGVWALTNGVSVTSGVGLPTLSSTVINSESYGFPPNAVTPPGFNAFESEPTSGIVASDFDAMQEVEYLNGQLVSALNTAITIPGDTGNRAGIAWFQVTPMLSGNLISGSSAVSQQGYIAAQGLYLLYPHINQSDNGTDAITFSLGGPNTFLSAAYAIKPAGASSFGAIHVAGAGTAPDNGFTATAAFGGVGRWGDYSNGEVNPAANTVWLATQYIPNNGDQFANWGNRIFEVKL